MACKDYCVYKHTLPNNKVYIGITKQIPSLRWANGRGYKHSNYFYNAILKYGWLNIRHEILRDCLTIEEAKILNCDQGHIRKCCQCKEGRKQHKGYIFKYKEEL